MAKQISEDDAKKVLEEGSKKITHEDVGKVLEKEKDIRDKFQSNSPLREYMDYAKTMFNLLKAYGLGEYKEVPWLTIASITVALLYVFSPIDLIPDVIPGIGLVDDALVIAICIGFVKEDLANFETWEANA